MAWLQVDKNKTNFTLDGKPFFYLADTIWSAFTNVTDEEWEYYLKRRKEQGFTVLQINTMPQWDRCMSDIGLYPFATEDGQIFDFTKWNQEYYEHAKQMCQKAVDMGFQLALVVLWLNHVPGTWGSRMNDSNVMPETFVKEYVEKIVSEFDRFHPIYVVSGDTDFDTPEAVSYYRTALDIVCEKSPHSLKSLHIKRGYDVIPEEFLDKIDFYMFQSGHNKDGQDMAYRLPQLMLEKYPKKPVINSEPCYEQMGFSRKVYGRFLTKDVRKAAWSSILSGACAGVTYGAHGIWNWQKINKPVNPIMGEGFDTAQPWQEAIKYAGAWDYGWIRQTLKELHIQKLIPLQEQLIGAAEEIRMAQTDDGRYLIYLPHSTKIKINGSLKGYSARAIDLESKRVAQVGTTLKEDITQIEMHPFEGDALIILDKE